MRFLSSLSQKARQSSVCRSFVALVLTGSLVSQALGNKPAQAQLTEFCQLSADAIAQKEALRQAAINGNQAAKDRYRDQLDKDKERLRQCRSQTWPQTQAVWLRLYPCDLKPGVLDKVMDRVVNRGYNQVYVEAFYDGQVLLPADDNPTAWPSVVRDPALTKADLLAQAIQKGRERGLGVYAWMYSMNFGYSFGQNADRQQVLARNGRGQTSLSVVNLDDANIDFSTVEADKVFVDPYSHQAKADLNRLIQAVLQRKPDGVLFDYIRYPHQNGAASVATQVGDLWIYGGAAQQALLQRAQNRKGRDLIQRYISQGHIKASDITAVNQLYPDEPQPLWQGRNSSPISGPRYRVFVSVDGQPQKVVQVKNLIPAAFRSDYQKQTVMQVGIFNDRAEADMLLQNLRQNSLEGTLQVLPPSRQDISISQSRLQQELWLLGVAHAFQGVVDFLSSAVAPVQQQGIAAGAVFFPESNRAVGRGYDSRMQPWDRFPGSIQWHPMSYAICGSPSCIVSQVQNVLRQAPAGTRISPVLAGQWRQAVQGRPSLEAQMNAIRQATPQINSVSHFAFSWQEPEFTQERVSCSSR